MFSRSGIPPQYPPKQDEADWIVSRIVETGVTHVDRSFLEYRQHTISPCGGMRSSRGDGRVPEPRRAVRRPAQADIGGEDSGKTGQKLLHFLAKLILEEFYGSVTIRFQDGKVTHVETETKRMWQHKDLPGPLSDCAGRMESTGGDVMATKPNQGGL